jgi:hypothetical protein
MMTLSEYEKMRKEIERCHHLLEEAERQLWVAKRRLPEGDVAKTGIAKFLEQNSPFVKRVET